MYMPIIEPIFAEYGIPDDLKYLVIQESALISDAVSSSNAVGFWQFKEASATEVGMRVDRQVDERMSIVGSTIGAAKYLLRSNEKFDNWLYSLQSYQMGLGGATRALNDRYYGAHEMKIDGDTYWYVKKFLSHLVAFRDAVGKQPRSLMLYQHKNAANKDLESISQEFDTDYNQLLEYNKWLKTKRVPDDRPYVVLIPVQLDEAPNLLAENSATAKNNQKRSLEDKLFGEKQKEPNLPPASLDKLVIAKVNGIQATVARAGDNARDLAKAGDVAVADFLKYNDIQPGDVLKPGQVYYFRKKKKKASVYRHVVAEGETLWDVSQKYGVRMDKLLQKNRMKQKDEVKPGQVLWLRHIRPADEPVAFEPLPKQKDEARDKTEARATPALQPQKTSAADHKAADQKKENPQQLALVVDKTDEAQKQSGLSRRPAEAPYKQAEAGKAEAGKKETPESREVAVADKPLVREQTKLVQDKQSEENKQAPAATTHEPAAQQQINQTVLVQVDTPLTRPATAVVKVQQQKGSKDSVALTEEELHLYPGLNTDQRNVSDEKKEIGAEPSIQVVERQTEDPDSFSVQGPVKFIGEEVQPEQQLPIRTAPVQAKANTNQPSVTQDVVVQVQQPSPAQQDSLHTVQGGETLYSISKRYGITVQQLRDRNRMGADAVLSIGQVLSLKAAASPLVNEYKSVTNTPQSQQESLTATSEDSRYVYHTVAEGETMYRVARKYNVTIKDIMEWNKKGDFNIHPGEVMVVGKK